MLDRIPKFPRYGPTQDSSTGMLISDNKEKPNIANQQFEKDFTKKVPLALCQLFTQFIHDGLDNEKLEQHSVPVDIHSKLSVMVHISISVDGITVNSLNIWTPKIFVVITLKF